MTVDRTPYGKDSSNVESVRLPVVNRLFAECVECDADWTGEQTGTAGYLRALGCVNLASCPIREHFARMIVKADTTWVVWFVSPL